ncbi:MAG TPA: glycosyltransferase [Atribacter sp.]|uniref:glycosyltransferase n=1 Tax=Atribacter sp. TaxID=2847780 RepID=UPI000232278F|nr:glycosyltransferase [Atribacter sp.]HQK83280.1 glycosyltransferase [Atribacter sp.]
MRVGIESIVLPPAASGQAIALYNLLKDIPNELFFFISSKCFEFERPTDSTKRLNVQYHRVYRAPWRFERVLLYFYCKFWKSPLLWYAKIISWQIKRILKQEKAEAIIACTADYLEPYSSFCAARSMKIPFILYAFDDYVSQHWIDKLTRIFSKNYGPILIKEADLVIAPNEFLQKSYYQKYGILPIVIHNPIDLKIYNDLKPNIFEPPKDLDQRKNKIKIVYTGAIYEAHYSAFSNLLKAIQKIPELNIQLHIYSEFSKENLIANGIKGPVIFHSSIKIFEVAQIQVHADILFLPLAFSSKYPDDIMRTASPMKMGEYLASGVPILVHAPSDSYVSWYFTQYNCGVVVDDDDPEKLAIAIKSLINDSDFRNGIVKNARERAIIDFSLDNAQDHFKKILTQMSIPKTSAV